MCNQRPAWHNIFERDVYLLKISNDTSRVEKLTFVNSCYKSWSENYVLVCLCTNRFFVGLLPGGEIWAFECQPVRKLIPVKRLSEVCGFDLMHKTYQNLRGGWNVPKITQLLKKPLFSLQQPRNINPSIMRPLTVWKLTRWVQKYGTTNVQSTWLKQFWQANSFAYVCT